MAAAIGTIVEVTVSGGTSGTSSGITTATGDSLVFCTQGDPSVTFNTPTDTYGNVPTVLAGGVIETASIQQGVWPKENCTGGGTHQATFTVSANSDFTAWFINITGVGAASLDSASSQNTDTSSPYTTTTAPLAQTGNIAVVLATSNSPGNPTTYSESTGFSKIAEEDDGSGHWSGAVFTKTTAATTALTPSVTITGGASDAVVACLVFMDGVLAVQKPLARPVIMRLRGRQFRQRLPRLLLNAASVPAAYELSFDPVSYTLTPADEMLSVGRALSFEPANYTLTAAAQTLTATRALSVDAASYVITAAPQTLTASRSLSIDPASYVLTAAPASFVATRALSIDPTAYTLTASEVTLSVGRALSIDPASYALTTADQTLTVDRAVNIEPTAYVLTAAPVELTYTPSGAVLSIDPVVYVLTPADVSFDLSSAVPPDTVTYPGGRKKRKKGEKGPIYYRHVQAEDIERMERAAQEVAAQAQQPKSEATARAVSLLKQYGIYREAYAQILLELEDELRAQQARDDDEIMAVVATCL